MSNKNYNGKKYDLEDRTTAFGENIIEFCKSIESDLVTKLLVSQLIGSATSIGTSYCETNCAGTKKDFIYELYLCKKI